MELSVIVAELKTGLFWRLLEPLSGSLGSLPMVPAVVSVPPTRSVPTSPLEWIELCSIQLPVKPSM